MRVDLCCALQALVDPTGVITPPIGRGKQANAIRCQTSIGNPFHALLNGDKNHCWLTGIGSQLASETQEALTITCKPAQKNASFDFI